MALCCTIFKLLRNLRNQILCRWVNQKYYHYTNLLICKPLYHDRSVVIPSTFFCVLLAGRAMWERLTAPEDGFSKLQRENLTIIESYGRALMEVVCRDACDGHEISRVCFCLLCFHQWMQLDSCRDAFLVFRLSNVKYSTTTLFLFQLKWSVCTVKCRVTLDLKKKKLLQWM